MDLLGVRGRVPVDSLKDLSKLFLVKETLALEGGFGRGGLWAVEELLLFGEEDGIGEEVAKGAESEIGFQHNK